MKKLIVRHFEELHNVLHPDGSLTQEKRADPQCCGFLRYIYAFDCDEFEGVASLDELVDEDVFEQLGFAHSY